MKKIFTLLAAAWVTLTSFAAKNDGQITILDFSRKQLIIRVDGNWYQEFNQQLLIGNLRPGKHTVEVYVQPDRYQGNRKPGFRSPNELLYKGTIKLKAREEQFVVINREAGVSITNRAPVYMGKEWDRYAGQGQVFRADRNAYVLDARSFDQLKRELQREVFEKNRLGLARQQIDQHDFTSAQVRELLLLFSFESSKLELAQYAYAHTIDKGNYQQLNTVFAFSSSRKALNDYIQRYR